MNSNRSGLRVSLFILLVLAGVIAVFYLEKKRAPDHTNVWKGRQVATQMGCFNCHGPEGIQGISNPGSEADEIPGWQGGTATMYLNDTSEIRQWVLYGKPNRMKKAPRGLIKMPSFKGKITPGQLNNLVAYLKAVMEVIDIHDTLAQKGYNDIDSLGCFGCHGPYGMGGKTNPMSFKGYIPGWDGKAFNDLVKNDDELKNWILHGKIKRLEDNIAAQQFTTHQIIKMPAFNRYINQSKLKEIIAYIKWVRKHPF